MKKLSLPRLHLDSNLIFSLQIIREMLCKQIGDVDLAQEIMDIRRHESRNENK